MNPEKVLQQICDQNNGKLTVEESVVEGDSGGKLHFVKYYLTMTYNDASFAIVYDFGNSVTADFKIEISRIANIPKFELSTIDHFTKLILFKSQHWKIRCKATHLKEKIEILFRKHKLDQLLQRTAFEPIIKGKTSAETYHIHTIFSLNFEENTKSIPVIVAFHQELIDVLKEKYFWNLV